MFTESAEFYDAIYSFKDYGSEAAQVASLLRDGYPGVKTILDVACGTGEHARLLAAQHGFEVDGLDLDTRLLRIARQKHAGGRFVHADMCDFAIDARYDAITCLFGSIGYLLTLERVRRAFDAFRRHLHPGGVLLVEPWFPPGILENGRLMRQTGVFHGRAVERTSRCEIEERISRLFFEYAVETATGVRRMSEVHELGLFTAEEIAGALQEARFLARLDPQGLTGRGLWIAQAPGASDRGR